MNRNKIKLLQLLVILLLAFYNNAQTVSTPEAIKQTLYKLRHAKHDSVKLKAYSSLSALYRKTSISLARAYSDSTLFLAEKLNNNSHYWFGLNSRGEAERIAGNLEKSMKIHLQALAFAEKNNFQLRIAHSYNNLGLILNRQENYKTAIEYITKARNIYKALNDSGEYISSSNNLGNCYMNTNELDKAIGYYQEVINFYRAEINSYVGNAYMNIGHCYYYKDEKSRAKNYYYKGLLLREKVGNPSDIADAYANYGYILYEEGEYAKAEEYYRSALILNKKAGNKNRLLLVYKYLSEVSVSKGDFKNAYYFADTTTMYRDSIINETNISSLNELNERFDSEKKQLQIESLSKENDYKENKNRQQRIFLAVVGIALLISVILGISVYKQFREKRAANFVIGKQKELLEEKQKEILDSLSYAKYLQEAILPPLELVKQHLPDSFILYKPKDIVAGDFYWMHYTESGHVLIAAADCTGHGVPGAMVSVVCSNALNRVVTEFNITNPGKILDKTRELVLGTFSRSNKNVNDGMDISLCCIDMKTKRVLWSGANNPLWYLQNGVVLEITADKQPVGKTENAKPFTTHELQLKAGDLLFLFTDGYADQFGGEKGKKFKYKPFKELLVSTSKFSPDNQKDELQKSFVAWKGSLEQVDDICVIGIRL